LQVGAARVTVLSPHPAVQARAEAGNAMSLNRLSSALAVEWEEVRLVLGADLPATDSVRIFKDWPEAAPGDHVGLKVPHHGSRASQAICLAQPTDDRRRWWGLTPWNKGSKLPRFELGEGVELMLRYVESLFLTSLPHETDLTSDEVTRDEIHRAIARSRFGDDMVLEYLSDAADAPDAWLAASFGADGAIAEIQRGHSSLTVLP
jgi:hypothetical protein